MAGGRVNWSRFASIHAFSSVKIRREVFSLPARSFGTSCFKAKRKHRPPSTKRRQPFLRQEMRNSS